MSYKEPALLQRSVPGTKRKSIFNRLTAPSSPQRAPVAAAFFTPKDAKKLLASAHIIESITNLKISVTKKTKLGGTWMPAKKKKSEGSIGGSVPLQDPVHEKFCRLIQSGIRPTAAALQCGLSKSSGNYFTKRPDILRRMRWLQKDAEQKVQETVVAGQPRAKMQAEVGQRRVVDIGRNEVIMILADIARDTRVVASSRVSAALGLADILLLRARSLRELMRGDGWTDDEIERFVLTGGSEVPERIRSFIKGDAVPSAGEGAGLRTNKRKTRSG